MCTNNLTYSSDRSNQKMITQNSHVFFYENDVNENDYADVFSNHETIEAIQSKHVKNACSNINKLNEEVLMVNYDEDIVISDLTAHSDSGKIYTVFSFAAKDGNKLVDIKKLLGSRENPVKEKQLMANDKRFSQIASKVNTYFEDQNNIHVVYELQANKEYTYAAILNLYGSMETLNAIPENVFKGFGLVYIGGKTPDTIEFGSIHKKDHEQINDKGTPLQERSVMKALPETITLKTKFLMGNKLSFQER